MEQPLIVEYDRQHYVWDGCQWYNALDYTLPHNSLLAELERLVPAATRAKMLGELCRENEPQFPQWHAAGPEWKANTMAYAELLAEFETEPIPYDALLATSEWHERRNQILARDDFTCRHCGCFQSPADPNTVLQVHHEHYIINRLPWEYPAELLTTLCRSCHGTLHRRDNIFVYEEIEGKLIRRNMILCPRCSGNGYFPQWRHVEDGICFRCRGTRVEKVEEIESPWIRAKTCLEDTIIHG